MDASTSIPESPPKPYIVQLLSEKSVRTAGVAAHIRGYVCELQHGSISGLQHSGLKFEDPTGWRSNVRKSSIHSVRALPPWPDERYLCRILCNEDFALRCKRATGPVWRDHKRSLHQQA